MAMANIANSEDHNLQKNASDLMLCAFALTDCVVHIESRLAKYLRAVHRTALELAVPNLFGSEIGGFWMAAVQIDQLKRLPDCYPANEITLVRRAVEAYLLAQTEKLDWIDIDNLSDQP
jgi:hypothetical protein